MGNKKNPVSISGNLLPKGSQLPSSFNLPVSNPSLSIIQQLNPLEHISNAIKTICLYKEQCKLIDLEMARLENEAKITTKKIDKLFLIEMEKLKSKRESAEMKLRMAAGELKDRSVTRKELMESISSLVGEICNPEFSVEAKKIARDTIKDLREMLNSTNDSSFLTLELLINNVNHDVDNTPLLGSI
ncbi:hypothetical protein UXO72_23660 [Enterobacter hormaechei]